jgi:sigma-B regulation protein RsbQ
MNPAQLLDATVTGDGPHTVVFGNGFATTQRAWDATVPHLPAGWRIVRFDYVGTTPSTTAHWIQERYGTYAGHADDLIRLLVHLNVHDAVFVGHSMSGMVSALASIRMPERLSHLLMVGASACYADRDDYRGGFTTEALDDLLRRVDHDLAAWMAGFSGSLMGRDARTHQLHEYMETLLAMRPDVGRTLLHSIFRSDYRDILGSIPARTTLVQTSDDVAVPLAAAEHLARHTRCNGLHVLPTSGHLPHITHPDLLLPILLDVLEQHTSRTIPPVT